VKDAERIYALYVQANPVPDPDLLPLNPDEAVLLTIEGSPDMITQEPTETHPAPRPPRRRNLAAAVAVVAVIAVALVATVLVTGDDGPVAAADANPIITFDGTSCTYDGPTLIEEGEITFRFNNSSTETLLFYGWLIGGQALESALEQMPIGTDIDPAGVPLPNGMVWFQSTIEPGATSAESSLSWQLRPGTYLLDCSIGDPSERMWRTAQIEVLAP
jgi:hypothetical protein